MNTSQLSKYAPEARTAFIAAVSAQAAKLGITAKGTADAKTKGDILLIAGHAFPASAADPRKKLIARVADHEPAHRAQLRWPADLHARSVRVRRHRRVAGKEARIGP